ncbi:MAG: sugar phosphate isomerase/epimerase family protein [Rhodanobacteraceae bacterium]
MASPLPLAVTSVILPDWTVAETCRTLQELGYTGVEWRVRPQPAPGPDGKEPAPSFWGRHLSDLSPANVLKKAAEVAKISHAHGLTITALAPRVSGEDPDQLKVLCEAARIMHCGMVRCSAHPDYQHDGDYRVEQQKTIASYTKAVKIAAEFGVKILLEIHQSTPAVSASLAYMIAKNFDPKHFGVIYDINNLAAEGWETYSLAMSLLGEYLCYVHLGNRHPEFQGLRPDGSVKWGLKWCGLQEGAADLGALFAALRKVNYQGFVALEDFRVMDAREKLRDAAAFLKTL